MSIPTTEARLSEAALIAMEVYHRDILPKLKPEDDGKFVAAAYEVGDFEVDRIDLLAIKRLRARQPEARVWLFRAGELATYRFR